MWYCARCFSDVMSCIPHTKLIWPYNCKWILVWRKRIYYLLLKHSRSHIDHWLTAVTILNQCIISRNKIRVIKQVELITVFRFVLVRNPGYLSIYFLKLYYDWQDFEHFRSNYFLLLQTPNFLNIEFHM